MGQPACACARGLPHGRVLSPTSEAGRGGVLERDGHTEAAVDLSRLAGLSGVTTMCELVRSDWGMGRLDDLLDLADRERLALVSVGDLAAYRRARAA
ncbi:3,4-dihydroxy-2-butanone-4-phosphate synthase [Kitasatospora sp. NPDC052896]|uniref:3,4-dihydroxy-2-butanone-4-phosphate synthase n=1 Tax=Kitasatospora sp. NPDC052896 TaxID=3364061 RepID=UPI0037CA7A86